jgi:hypothetical protein
MHIVMNRHTFVSKVVPYKPKNFDSIHCKKFWKKNNW